MTVGESTPQVSAEASLATERPSTSVASVTEGASSLLDKDGIEPDSMGMSTTRGSGPDLKVSGGGVHAAEQ